MTADIEARLALADTVQDVLDRLEAAYEQAVVAGYCMAVTDLIARTEALSGALLAEIQNDGSNPLRRNA